MDDMRLPSRALNCQAEGTRSRWKQWHGCDMTWDKLSQKKKATKEEINGPGQTDRPHLFEHLYSAFQDLYSTVLAFGIVIVGYQRAVSHCYGTTSKAAKTLRAWFLRWDLTLEQCCPTRGPHAARRLISSGPPMLAKFLKNMCKISSKTQNLTLHLTISTQIKFLKFIKYRPTVLNPQVRKI